MPSNPYMTGGRFPMPRPLSYDNPQIQKLAEQYSMAEMGAVSQHMGQRGLTNTSFLPAQLGRAYQRGFRSAVGDYLQQQGLYNQYSQMLMQLEGGQGPKQQEPSFWQRLFGGAATGASAGGAIGGGAGAGIGAGIGAAASALNLF